MRSAPCLLCLLECTRALNLEDSALCAHEAGKAASRHELLLRMLRRTSCNIVLCGAWQGTQCTPMCMCQRGVRGVAAWLDTRPSSFERDGLWCCLLRCALDVVSAVP